MSSNYPLKLAIFTLIIFLSFIYSCKETSSDKPNYMAFDHVEYVNDFPATFIIKDRNIPDIKVIGIRNFVIYDSLMVLSTSNPEGIWSFISLPDLQILGSFLKRGEGPLEFMQGPSAADKTKIVREKDRLVAYIYDFQKGKLKKLDIGQTIATGEMHLNLMEAALPPFLSNFIMVDSITFFIKEIENRDRQQNRYLILSGKKTELPILGKLNQATLNEGGDFNILATNTRYSDVNKRFVEAPTGLNYINLYSLDSSIAKTICFGDKLTDIVEVENERPQWNRKIVFLNIKAFDSFFAVIHVNESFKDYEVKRKRLPSIFLFDWEGKPLAELKMHNHFTHFDIDFINQELYTFDSHSDEFFKFDVRNMLASLNRIN
jgi:hypothetical protein